MRSGKIYSDIIGFADVDFGRFPFYGRYFSWIEAAWEQCLHEVDVWYSDLVGQRKIGLPVTSLDCRYRRPMGLDDEFFLPLRLTELTSTGLRLEFRFVRAADAVVAAEGELVRRFIDMERKKTTELPEDLTDRFARLAQELAEWPDGLAESSDDV